MKTKQQISEIIDILNKIKKTVNPKTVFADTRLKALNAQIEVLTKSLTLNEIFRDYGKNQFVQSAAIDALDWKNEKITEFIFPNRIIG